MRNEEHEVSVVLKVALVANMNFQGNLCIYEPSPECCLTPKADVSLS